MFEMGNEFKTYKETGIVLTYEYGLNKVSDFLRDCDINEAEREFEAVSRQMDLLQTVRNDMVTFESAISGEQLQIESALIDEDNIVPVTYESALNSLDKSLKNIGFSLSDVGLGEGLSMESAVLTVESGDSAFKKLWDWILNKLATARKYLSDLYDRLFSKTDKLVQVNETIVEELKASPVTKPKVPNTAPKAATSTSTSTPKEEPKKEDPKKLVIDVKQISSMPLYQMFYSKSDINNFLKNKDYEKTAMVLNNVLTQITNHLKNKSLSANVANELADSIRNKIPKKINLTSFANKFVDAGEVDATVKENSIVKLFKNLNSGSVSYVYVTPRDINVAIGDRIMGKVGSSQEVGKPKYLVGEYAKDLNPYTKEEIIELSKSVNEKIKEINDFYNKNFKNIEEKIKPLKGIIDGFDGKKLASEEAGGSKTLRAIIVDTVSFANSFSKDIAIHNSCIVNILEGLTRMLAMQSKFYV